MQLCTTRDILFRSQCFLGSLPSDPNPLHCAAFKLPINTSTEGGRALTLVYEALVWVIGLHGPTHVSAETQHSLGELLDCGFGGRLIGCNLITLWPFAAFNSPPASPSVPSTCLLTSLNLQSAGTVQTGSADGLKEWFDNWRWIVDIKL